MIASLVLAAAACSWSNPGHARFTGNDSAVDDYKDIPASVRAVLRERIRKHDYNDIAEIRSSGIQGAGNYDDLRDMHFGSNGMCKTVKMKWKPTHVERGLVYCEGETCIIIPTVCNNIARVTRRRGNSPGFASALQSEAASFAGAETPPLQVASAGGAGGAGGGSVGDPGFNYDSLPPTGAGNTPSTFASGSGGTGGGFAGGYPVIGGGSIGGGGGFLIPPIVTVPVDPVPEPATWALLLSGVAAIGAIARRRPRA